MVAQELNSFGREVARFCRDYILENQGFNLRTFYGAYYTFFVLNKTGLINENTKTILLEITNSLDKNHISYHWEFINNVLLDMESNNISNHGLICRPLRFRHTPVANWILLRNLCLLKEYKSYKMISKEVLKTLNSFQTNYGFIKDDHHVFSLQYHCFSLSILAEIIILGGEEAQIDLLESFEKGMTFILSMMLPNGQFEYLGRGQEQIFGYGPFFYSLCFSKLSGLITGQCFEKYYTMAMEYLRKYQRRDGSFPLVLRDNEKTPPLHYEPDGLDTLGWYAYNNYFDYLPFLSFYLLKTADLFSKSLQNLGISNGIVSEEFKYQSLNTLFLKKKLWRDSSVGIICARTYGAWTNCLPLPLIYDQEKVISCVFGGEQFGSQIYSPSCLPLPYWKQRKISFYQKSRFFLFKDGTILLGLGIWGIFFRKMVVSPFQREIEFKESYWGPFPFRNRHLYSKKRTKIKLIGVQLGEEYCPLHVTLPKGARVDSDKEYNYEEELYVVELPRKAQVKWKIMI